MRMNLENIRDLLNGAIDAGMCEEDMEITVYVGDDRKTVTVDAMTIYKNTEGVLIPKFNGWLKDA